MGLGIPAVGVSRFEVLADRDGEVVVGIADKRGSFVQAFRCGAPLGPPMVDPAGPPEVPAGGIVLDATDLRCDLVGLARIAARRLDRADPPAPLYLRAADAMPPSESPPLILDDA
jgi:hypothetical protein